MAGEGREGKGEAGSSEENVMWMEGLAGDEDGKNEEGSARKGENGNDEGRVQEIE